MDGDAHDQRDRPETRRRATVPEAAERLGITVEAVRGRIKRGTLEHEREDDRVYVLLGDDQSAAGRDQGKDRPPDRSQLVEVLQDQVAYLREQLDEERRARTEERRRHDTIIAQLTSRIPELGAPREGQERPREPAEASGGVEPRSATGGPRRGFWSRWLGG